MSTKRYDHLSVSDELDKFIEEHGNALNVALAQLRAANMRLGALYDATAYIDCPCGGCALPGYVCSICGNDELD